MALAPGTRLGPYEILSPLGAGGMGEVFRARDTRLGRDVAVKVLPDHLAGDHKVLARFESEARAVAALSHPNILALYDVGQAGSVHFAVAELLEGETLRSLLSRGPLPLRRALAVARQIADALAAAHEKGIVHRDLKPENVFLSRDDHAKVLDFGLARHDPALHSIGDSLSPTASVLTHDGEILGTVPYMSPEQARGLRVDFRSDQFSLGSLLYEMLSGKRPFRGATAADVLAAIIRDEPEPLSRLLDGLPPQLLSVLDRCLAKEPTGRYESSRDLARDLDACWLRLSGAPEGITAPASAGAAVSAGRPAAPSGKGRRVAVGFTAAAVLLAAAALLVVRGRGRSSTPEAQTAKGAAGGPVAGAATLEPKRVVVAIFENRTGDPSLDALGKVAADWITEAIVPLGADVLPSSFGFGASTQQASSPDGDPALALARRTGAGLLVAGSYNLAGERIQVRARLFDAATGRVLAAPEPASGPREDPMQALEGLRAPVRDALAIRLDPVAARNAGLSDLSRPPAYAAYREFVLALEKQEDLLVSRRHLEEAIDIDPDFDAARVFLADRLAYERRYAECFAHVDVVASHVERLTPFQRVHFETVRAFHAGRYGAALDSSRQLIALASDSTFYRSFLITSALAANRPAEALATVEKLVEADPSLPGTMPLHFTRAADSLHVLGRYEAELRVVRKGVSRDAAGEPALMEPRPLVALGRLEEAVGIVRERSTRPPGIGGVRVFPGTVFELVYLELRAHGRRPEAIAVANEAVERHRMRPEAEARRYVRDLAWALYHAERWAEARPVLRAAADAFPETWPTFVGLEALAAQRLGDASFARRIEEELRTTTRPWLHGEHTYFRACLATLRGEKEEAVKRLAVAIEQGWPNPLVFHFLPVVVHTDVNLDPLRGYPPFEELVRPRG